MSSPQCTVVRWPFRAFYSDPGAFDNLFLTSVKMWQKLFYQLFWKGLMLPLKAIIVVSSRLMSRWYQLKAISALKTLVQIRRAKGARLTWPLGVIRHAAKPNVIAVGEHFRTFGTCDPKGWRSSRENCCSHEIVLASKNRNALKAKKWRKRMSDLPLALKRVK